MKLDKSTERQKLEEKELLKEAKIDLDDSNFYDRIEEILKS